MRPIVLPPNGIPRFYRGGPAIAALRGIDLGGDHVPEEWVGSMTTVFGERELGLSRLPDGTYLRDAAARDPVAFFGPDHAARFGADPALLVKLLDAGQRLPVHAHPDDAFARAELGSRYGKTEAWIVVAAADGAHVHIGFRDDVALDTLDRWVHAQDHEAMLAALNPLPVAPGEAIFVPAGVPHAIGEGVLIVELQEPTDLSVLLEWQGFGIDDACEATLGLGWARALRCIERGGCDGARLRGPAPDGRVSRLLPRAADAFFRAQRLAPGPDGVELEPGFAILVVVEGEGRLGDLAVRRGDAILVPHAAGTLALAGDLVAIACRPPEAPA